MGVMTFKYKIKVRHAAYILRIYPPANTTRTDLEFEVMHGLFSMGCKVPEPVRYNNAAGLHWLLYKFIEGQPLSNLLHALTTTEINTIAAQIMHNLLNFSKLPVQGFGFLLTGEEIFSNWNNFLLQSIQRGAAYLPLMNEFDNPTIDLLLAFATKQTDLISTSATALVWSDFSPGNIIIHNKSLAGLVDFEGCISGDATLALGYLFAIEGHSSFFESMLLQFKKHFVITHEQIVFYTIIRLFRLSKYFNVAFPTGIHRDPLKLYFKGIPVAIEYIRSLKATGS
jgi:aminoglycoside phosphotransferase (APT) family kinase protein